MTCSRKCHTVYVFLIHIYFYLNFYDACSSKRSVHNLKNLNNMCIYNLMENISIMYVANELGLYEREYYFYDSLLRYVPVKAPEFYGLIKDDDFNNIGILMNNLTNLDYKLNLNLNNEKIDVSLKVIERLAQLHSKFWNKDLQKNFKGLKKHTDSMFNPKWHDFIKDNWQNFKVKWSNILSEEQIASSQHIVDNYQHIQNGMSDKNLTLCHGDVKSAKH